MKHPFALTNDTLKDHYMIIDGDYKGSVYELKNVRFGGDAEIMFDLDLVALQFKERPVTDIFLINYHFGIIQQKVSDLVVEALKSYIDANTDKEAANIADKPVRE